MLNGVETRTQASAAESELRYTTAKPSPAVALDIAVLSPDHRSPRRLLAGAPYNLLNRVVYEWGQSHPPWGSRSRSGRRVAPDPHLRDPRIGSGGASTVPPRLRWAGSPIHPMSPGPTADCRRPPLPDETRTAATSLAAPPTFIQPPCMTTRKRRTSAPGVACRRAVPPAASGSGSKGAGACGRSPIARRIEPDSPVPVSWERHEPHMLT
jgi:hypothetical protein